MVINTDILTVSTFRESVFFFLNMIVNMEYVRSDINEDIKRKSKKENTDIFSQL